VPSPPRPLDTLSRLPADRSPGHCGELPSRGPSSPLSVHIQLCRKAGLTGLACLACDGECVVGCFACALPLSDLLVAMKGAAVACSSATLVDGGVLGEAVAEVRGTSLCVVGRRNFTQSFLSGGE
jgi:hypothetical protein